MTRMDDHGRILENEILALWLAPLVSTLPLIPFFSFRFSPLFLGALMADASHPTNWPWLGPLIAATGVIFDGTILGGVAELLIALPIYLVLRKFGWLSRPKVVALGVLAAIGASQFVAFTQRSSPFQQSALTQFAVSSLSPALACLSGGTAGLCVAYLTSRRTKLREPLSFFGFLLPIVSLMICVLTLTSSSQVWRAR
jgi:hypothetical protein